MATKTARRSLGRGLAALIPESDFDLLNTVARGDATPLPIEETRKGQSRKAARPEEEIATVGLFDEGRQSESQQSDARGSGDIRYLEIASILPNPFQPRQIFVEEDLENLAASLREHGVLQPVLVRPQPTLKGATQYQLIAGERRWRAASRAGLTQVPALVREVDDQSALELAIIENVQRHDISSIESAQAFKRLSKEFGLSQEQIAIRVGKSRAAIANTIRLLDLPEEAIGALRESKISEGHGRALLTATSDGARRALLRRAVRDGLSVRDLERLARESNDSSKVDVPRLARIESPDMARLETTLQRALGARLKLKSRRRGGQIIIDFSSPEELARLIKKMTRPSGDDVRATGISVKSNSKLVK